MSFYSDTLKNSLKEKVAFFENAGLQNESAELKRRLEKLNFGEEKLTDNNSESAITDRPIINSKIEQTRERLQLNLNDKKYDAPQLEKDSLLKKLKTAETLADLQPLRVAYIERFLKILRVQNSEQNADEFSNKEATGPYNNRKTLNEALQLIYAQDPLWLEDLKELYLPIISESFTAAVSKSSL
ncbi:hypothetical protein AGMMS49938_08700 [Fibrobacterales bacterium]|nr:hypothetical protein AGMMS49938_08700 [Fibrobacterales bacterium]